MKQIQVFREEQETVTLERSVGNLFEEFLELNGRLADFDKLSKIVTVVVDGDFIRVNLDGTLNPKGFVAKVSQVLKSVIKPTQSVVFQPITASG